MFTSNNRFVELNATTAFYASVTRVTEVLWQNQAEYSIVK